ncbi:hypothetical protein LINGRAHAP2_LOCUS26460, partial [Linum grandiflorum]
KKLTEVLHFPGEYIDDPSTQKFEKSFLIQQASSGFSPSSTKEDKLKMAMIVDLVAASRFSAGESALRERKRSKSKSKQGNGALFHASSIYVSSPSPGSAG